MVDLHKDSGKYYKSGQPLFIHFMYGFLLFRPLMDLVGIFK